MTIDLDRFVKFLRDAKITPTQYTFLATMYEKKYQLIYMLKEISKNVLPKDELEDLIDRGFIYNWNPEGSYALDHFEATQKFIDLYEGKAEWVCAEQFIDAFPRFIHINGKQVPARNCDLDVLEKTYYRKIVKRGLHDEVMTQLKWAIDNRKISMGIEKWFVSRQWEAIKEMRNFESNVSLPSEQQF